MKKDNNRTDRILILVALAILLIAASLFYFDQWMWGTKKSRGTSIGVLASRTGDVRLKFENDLRWQKASVGQELVYNDAVYAGEGAEAHLRLGDARMTVNENTLIVLRREQDINFLNLNYGTLFGKLGREKLMVDTGDGKPIEVSALAGADIVLKKTEGRTQLDVRSGEADVTVNGKVTRVSRSSRMVLGKARRH
ncbi:MAG: hypothetical protein HC902_10100 [Calothrix sp. SM1_5_4]|nr:hypothetical protein [Calothrix sp. SM1_5_4]